MASSDKTDSQHIFPANFEEKIDFTLIKNLIRSYCLFDIGLEFTDKLSFSTNRKLIIKKLQLTVEFKEICLNHPAFPTAHFFDLREELKRIETKGTFIEPVIMPKLLLSLETINNISTFFKKADNDIFPTLKELSQSYSFDKTILKEGRRIIDKNGKIKDTASDTLSEIREALISLALNRDKKLEKIYSSMKSKGFAPDTGITIRNGRFVIPVHAAHKRQVKGFIYDESATGQTVFIEPTDVFELNNEINDKKNQEKREIIKILTVFTDFLRSGLNDIYSCFHFLGLIDFLRAKALFAISIKGIAPEIKARPFIEWRNAVHPILYLKNIKTKQKTVPLTLSMNEAQKVMLISGPNAGGKSVCLKTAGLLQYMLQCGIPIPVDESSKAGLFDKLFIDIGDEQSLENDLSTYSSHLKNMHYFINHADAGTLFLIDELGAGTEPQIGGAIAEAILESLYKLNSYGLVTTHYLNLKMLPQKYDKMCNAAMLFDSQNLKPLFVLSTGEPGSSFAFEIAQSIGLPAKVIEEAKSKIDAHIVDFESYYLKVKEKDRLMKERMKDLDKSDAILHETHSKYQKLLDEIEDEKMTIIAQAKKEAEELLKQTNRKVEHLIKTIKESQADKATTNTLRKDMEAFKEQIAKVGDGKPLPDFKPPKAKKKKNKKTEEKAKAFKIDTSTDPIKKGDYVIIDGSSQVVLVEAVKHKTAHIVSGNISLKLAVSRLQRVINYKPPARNTRISRQTIADISEKQRNFKAEIDLRGKRAEEALTLTDTYINDAVLCGAKQVRILHGKGDGILRKLIQESLRRNEMVERCHDEHIEFGGQGITVVYLK